MKPILNSISWIGWFAFIAFAFYGLVAVIVEIAPLFQEQTLTKEERLIQESRQTIKQLEQVLRYYE